MTQIEMTGCAARDHAEADAELNRVYARAMERARTLDVSLPAGEIPAVDILRDAQRAWIPFRDGACTAESLLARGGSMQNQVHLMCLARLTRARTADLQIFAEVR